MWVHRALTARLLAAAPALLEAARAVLAADGEDWETGRRVLAAAVRLVTQEPEM